MKSKIFQDKFKRRNFFRHEFKLIAAKSILRDERFPTPFRFKINNFLSTYPKNCSITQLNNRCVITARSRAVYKNFRISRLMFRKYASQGNLAGIKKSS
jgi:succinate dehydrogenase (ubiquinone) iron-sulfur subunit